MGQNKIALIIEATDDASIKIKKFSGNLDDLGKKAKDTEKKTGGLGDQAGILGGILGGITAAGVLRAAQEFALLGAQVQRTTTAFTNISGGSQLAADNLNAMRAATRGAISDTSAMEQANRLLQMGLVSNAEELGRVTEMAVTLGTSLGRDASQSIEEFALLLANRSLPRLDTFGISAGNVRARMEELRNETQGITQEQAFLTAVQEQGEIAMARLGDQTFDNALAFEQLQATLENTRDDTVGVFADIGGAAAASLNLLLTWNDRIVEVLNEHSNSVIDTSESYEAYNAAIMESVEGTPVAIDAQGNLINAAGGLIQSNFLLTEAGWEVARSLDEITASTESSDAALLQLATGASTASEDLAPIPGITTEIVQQLGKVSEFDNKFFFNLAIASATAAGTLSENADAIGRMAVQMGIMTQAEFDALVATNELAGEFAETGDEEAYIAGVGGVNRQLALTTSQANIAASEVRSLSGGMAEGVTGADTLSVALDTTGQRIRTLDTDSINLSTSLEIATGRTEPLAGGLQDIETAAGEASGGVGDLEAALGRLPSEVSVRVITETTSIGGGIPEYQRGADVIAQDTMAFVHAGEMVLNPQAAAMARAMGISNTSLTNNNEFNLSIQAGSLNGPSVINSFNSLRAMVQR